MSKEEEDNMSIGELAQYLMSLPESIQHLPVKLLRNDETVNLINLRLSVTDGTRYYSTKVLEPMQTFPGMYLEITTD